MAIEAGGTSGVCYPDMTTVEYLWEHIKGDYKSKEDALSDYRKWISDERTDDSVIDIDVNTLEPMVTYGFKPNGNSYGI